MTWSVYALYRMFLRWTGHVYEVQGENVTALLTVKSGGYRIVESVLWLAYPYFAWRFFGQLFGIASLVLWFLFLIFTSRSVTVREKVYR